MRTPPIATGVPSVATARPASGLRKVIIATSLGNGLEIFDFTVFSFFAAMIGAQFFPADDPMTSLLLAVGTFGVGFFMRPLGAMVIGAYADRVGRRAAMMLTIWLMAVGTAAIGCCPSFARIGLAAPLIVIAGRLLQGFAAGGEVGAATTFLMESGPVSRRGFLVSWQLGSQGAAALLGASIGVILTRTLSPNDLAAWGWRVPFLIGMLIAPVGLYVRRQLHDVPRPEPTSGTATMPLVELCQKHGRTVMLATMMMIGGTVSMYIIVYYMPSYLTRVMHMPPTTGFLSATLSALLMFVIAPLSGLLADKLKRRKPLVLFTTGCNALLVYPAFFVITHAHSLLPILAGVGIISALMALGSGAGTLLLLEAFPPHVRASGLAIPYAVGATLFGGTAQLVVTWLIKSTGDPMSAAWYVAPASLISLVAVALFKERRPGM
ncbi:MFS transporter [Paraburkholderia saeva]|uniref:MFS transporter n=1 Tax=Paraburkholderia saeva TaxID=2777537 RepID=UPI001DB47320|nr:MFS transporter [Paraburkholderia saeva]CAG4895985.1 Proline/betaine transporter [Paraburkholderia saeva]